MPPRRPFSSVTISEAIVVSMGRSITVPGIVVCRWVSVTRIGMRRTVAITLVRILGAMAICAGDGTIALRRAGAPMRRTNAMMSIFIDDRHAIVVLHNGAAVFAIFVDENRCVPIFDGRSEILPIRGEYRRRLRVGRSGAENKKRYCDNLSHIVLHSIINRTLAAPQFAAVTKAIEPDA